MRGGKEGSVGWKKGPFKEKGGSKERRIMLKYGNENFDG